MFNVQIDGVWHQFPKGTRVIEACEQVGVFVPRYCYHKKLSSPGNCRMCLIEMGFPRLGPDRKPELGADGKPIINWMPRPQISCAQDVAEGMAVRTDSPLVKECQRGVMEFLLINHPLDCPICDQAGECRLQEFSVDYGNSQSRFLENKVKKPKNVQLGPRVTLDDERCILCSRCIRFCQEIAHDDVLGFVDRGSHTVLTAHPGKSLNNNYSLNTVDICPVGALTSTDFRFKMRVWFLKETKSICTSCATGCNTVLGTREDVTYRQTPRENNHVNSCWMCDYGRLNYKYLEAPDRLLEPQIRSEGKLVPADWPTAIGAGSAPVEAILRIRDCNRRFGTDDERRALVNRATGELIRSETDRYRSKAWKSRPHFVEQRSQSKHHRRAADSRFEFRARRKTREYRQRGEIRSNQSLGDSEGECDAPGLVGGRTRQNPSPGRNEYIA